MDALIALAKRASSPAFRRLAPRLAVLALAWMAMTGGVFSGGCNLFRPAVPEPPTLPPIIPNYRSPEKTLATMAVALAAKAQGSQVWLGAFGDSAAAGVPGFHQFFDPADVAVYQGSCQCTAPSDWNLGQEQSFYLALLNVRPSDSYAARFDSVAAQPDPPPNDDTHVLLHRYYHVIATSPDGNSSLVIAIGYADLYFTKDSGERWLITRWDDHVDPAVTANPVDPYQLSLGRRRLESVQ